MIKTASAKSDRSQTYQQALDDFGITQLLSYLTNYVDTDFNAQLMNLEEQELKSLAAILIQRLISNLNGKLIASYLNAIRYGDSHIIFDPTNLQIPLPSIDLPAHFLKTITPRYQEGDRVRWRPISNTTDWGIVIGRFYTQHHCQWTVYYIVKLDRNSPSAAWIVADTAWEEDLEPIADNDGKLLENEENALCDRETNPHALHPVSLSPSPTPEQTKENTLTKTSAKNGYALPNPRTSLRKSLRTSPGDYSSGEENRTNPRILTQRERDLIELYSNCQLGLTPRRFYTKWSVRYQEMASICSRSVSTVERWFNRGSAYRRPMFNDLRHLALMDFLLEHFEQIPSELLDLLCPQNRIERG